MNGNVYFLLVKMEKKYVYSKKGKKKKTARLIF